MHNVGVVGCRRDKSSPCPLVLGGDTKQAMRTYVSVLTYSLEKKKSAVLLNSQL